MVEEHAVILGRRYELQEPLGTGGMGTVYRAYDLLTHDEVALKRVNPIEDSDSSSTAAVTDLRLAMAREFKVLASLRHPHIIAVRDYGFDSEGHPYFTMDLLRDAQTIIAAGRGRNIDYQVTLIVQMLQALAHLHRRDIIHRDLKPANVLIVDGQVKLLDFGLSVIKQDYDAENDGVSGTLAYMAPEVMRGGAVSAASDLYAVGVMAYEMMAGRHPFTVKNVQMLLREILAETPDLSRIDANDQLTGIIGQLMSKQPIRRLTDANEAIIELSNAIGSRFEVETAATRESFLQSARLVGRELEMTNTIVAMQKALRGEGSAWLIGGESGVGKSRFVEEMRISAMVRGALVVRGQASGQVGQPYDIWQPILRWLTLLAGSDTSAIDALMPEAGSRDVLPPAEAQTRVMELIVETVQTLGQPLVLLFEDLQWAGSNSIALLNRLAGAVENLPLLILGTYRTDERVDLPKDLSRLQHFTLGRLSPQSIAELSEAMLGNAGRREQVVQLLQRETEGNVFFLVEVVRALAEEAGTLDRVGLWTLPESVFAGGVQKIVQRRLDRVPEDAQNLLQVAAAHNRLLDLDLLRTVAPDEDLDRWLVIVADAAVLDVQDGEWRFAHDKLREGILAGLTPELRRGVHRRVALALEALYPDEDDHIMPLTYHWRMAEEPVREEWYVSRAGVQAVRSGAYAEAVQYLRKAVVLAKATGEQDDQPFWQRQFGYRLHLADAYLGMGDYEVARSLQETNLEIAEEAHDRLGEAVCYANIGDIEYVLANYDKAQACYQRSLELFRAVDEQPGVARVLNSMGDVAYELGDPEKANRYYQASMDLARALGVQWGKAGGYVNERDDDVTAPIEQRQLLLMQLAEAESGAERVRLTSQLAAVTYAIGDFEGAARHYREALREATRADENVLALQALVGVGRVHNMLGDKERALEILAQVLHHPDSTDELHDEAERLVFELQEDLPPGAASSAWDRGKSAAFDVMVRQVLA